MPPPTLAINAFRPSIRASISFFSPSIALLNSNCFSTESLVRLATSALACPKSCKVLMFSFKIRVDSDFPLVSSSPIRIVSLCLVPDPSNGFWKNPLFPNWSFSFSVGSIFPLSSRIRFSFILVSSKLLLTSELSKASKNGFTPITKAPTAVATNPSGVRSPAMPVAKEAKLALAISAEAAVLTPSQVT